MGESPTNRESLRNETADLPYGRLYEMTRVNSDKIRING